MTTPPLLASLILFHPIFSLSEWSGGKKQLNGSGNTCRGNGQTFFQVGTLLQNNWSRGRKDGKRGAGGVGEAKPDKWMQLSGGVVGEGTGRWVK